MFMRSRRERLIEIMNREKEDTTPPQKQNQEISADKNPLTDPEAGADTIADNPEEEQEAYQYQKGDFIPMMAASFLVWLLAILGILIILGVIFFLFKSLVT
jgi:hypothetical protein